MLNEIRDLYAYTRWANGRMLDACAALGAEAFTRDLGSSFPSIQATLAHTLRADWLWLRRWQGESPTGAPEGWDLSTPSAVRAEWERVEEGRAAYLAALAEEELESVVAYRNLAGDAFEGRLHHLLRHVVNHSTYHRGQVAGMLRQVGSRMESTDLVLFYRLQDASRPAVPA